MMKHSIAGVVFRLSALVATIVLTAAVTTGQPAANPGQGAKYDLTKIEGMKAFVGSEAAGKMLARNGFVVTGGQFKQIFSAYVDKNLPKFITTDSAWHTYHVLLEEGVKRLEESQARRLAEFSRNLMDAAKSDKGGLDELADLAAVGLAMQDAAFEKTLPKRQAGIVHALKSGSASVKIPVGFPLAPGQFRAGSFYTKSSVLSDYFAARQWYAMVDFRLKSDRETALAVKLAMLIDGDKKLSGLWRQLSEPYDSLLAKSEDGTVRAYAHAAAEVLGKEANLSDVDKNIAAIRKLLAGKLSDPKVNDQLLSPSQHASFPAEIKGFRLLPPRRLPSAVCFQNTVDPKIKGRMLPSGLDFMVACKTLNSTAASRALEGCSGESVAQAVARTDCGQLPDSLHGQAMKLLSLLQKPLPKSAPAALRTKAWGDKQLWTQLGAWAEQRHTWALHTKVTFYLQSFADEPAGMVSPYPEFFEGLGRLTRTTAKAFKESAVDKFHVRDAARDLLAHVKYYREILRKQGDDMPYDDEKINRMAAFISNYRTSEKFNVSNDADWKSILDKIEKLARKCAVSEEVSKDDEAALKLFARPIGDISVPLASFAGLCDKLAGIARRQLARKTLTKEDNDLIRNYGEILGRLHFYDGDSYKSPCDDFPMVTPIAVSPVGNMNRILYAGLARPQALYVIGTARGKPYLLLGSVMSYRECRRPINQPLNDESWMALVGKGLAPSQPEFTRSFIVETTEKDVVEILRSGKIYGNINQIPGREITKVLIELIGKGKHPDVPWLIEHLGNRYTEQDVGDIVTLMANTSVGDGFCDLVRYVSYSPVGAHRDVMMKMLRDDSPKRATAAAYVLSRKPDKIDVKKLLMGFDKQSVHTKRVYCYLLSCVGKADAGVKKVLLGALTENDPGLRWQAIAAMGKIDLGGDGVKALIDRIEDKNEFVASEAVQLLAKLKARQAAPALLARLKKGVRSLDERGPIIYLQSEAITRSVAFDGTGVVRILLPDWKIMSSEPTPLGKALIEAMGVFVYKPASKQLIAMLNSTYADRAVWALGKIDPKKHVDRLLALSFNQAKEVRRTRIDALKQLGKLHNAQAARRLLPLLKETTEPLHRSMAGAPRWRICDQAAQTIASMLGWKDTLYYYNGMEKRTKLIAKIHQWAKTKEQTQK